ncbi:beta-1,6-galactofuranosyltransferase [Weissella oryzae SG25]|uniref:Beta-1,6-galactofuranosyltransferase n=1 Tax=Weissella oryzae (strain DSM 25784 / JCM 18191 / LMG 30913 / SG25) TaxID=1329250 RepID=A0A069CVB5_WEIOS|nr:beta-1,6-galactofuranosyltransferase [Weissella oryzae]GAK31173.1 beta-1,6-galactofuranosyltransferase [Weissella oryzae SG25]
MTKWIVRFNASDYSQKYDAIYIVSKNVARSAQQLGFKEINLSPYSNLDNNPSRRSQLLKALLGPIQPDDLVVVQYPLWTNMNFQAEFIDYLKRIQDIKIVGLLHDVPTWMFTDEHDNYDRENDFWLGQLRRFDLLLVANEKVGAKLQEDGVHVPMIAMHIWDYFYDGQLLEKTYRKQLYYVAGRNIINFDYVASTPINFYGREVSEDVKKNPSVNYLGRLPSDMIVANLTGGFGLVVSDNIKEKSNMNFVYYNQFNNPTKLSLYIAAGLPVIIASKTAHAEWIKKAGIGLVVDDLNEIDQVLAQVSPADYDAMLQAIKPWQTAVSGGFFVKRSLMAMLRYINLGFDDVLIKDNKNL